MVEGLVKDGAQTIVVVGNDETLQKVMWFLPDLPIVVGYIPVCEPFGIATLLGIPSGDAACDVLAARLIETLDIGKINDRYFLTEARVEHAKAVVDIDGCFRIGPSQGGTISIRNLGGVSTEGLAMADAKDGQLEATICPADQNQKPSRFDFFRPPKPREETCLPMKRGTIESREPIDVIVDGHPINGFRFQIEILPGKFRIVTGRNRRLGSAISSPVLPFG